MFKSVIISALLIFSSLSAFGQPEGKQLGAGVSLGWPTGVAARYFLNKATSLQGILGWRGGENGAVFFQADYLLHYDQLPVLDFGKLQAFYGGGANITLANNPGFGFQVTGGLSLFLNELPMEIGLHLSPGMALLPSTGFRVGTGLSVRYYF
jgi:hypothetical protein